MAGASGARPCPVASCTGQALPTEELCPDCELEATDAVFNAVAEYREERNV